MSLSFAQHRLWGLSQLEGVSQANQIPLALRLTGELNTSALRKALDRLVGRHEALRTRFERVDGEPLQRIAAEGCGFVLQEYDLRQYSEVDGELQRLAVEEANTAFDLLAGPLIRGRLIRLADREHVLLITVHQIVSDAWSMDVLTRELGALYWVYSRGQDDFPPALAVQYPDYAVWQRQWLSGEILQAQSDFWQRTLADAPAQLVLPSDRHRPVQQDHVGAVVPLELDKELTASLKALSRCHGATLFMTLLAGWAAVLTRLSGQDEVVIGAPIANRSCSEVEPLIGLFVNTLALRLDLSGGATLGEVLQRVKNRTLEAQQHQDLPFEQVVEIVRPLRSLAYTPVFQVMFAWQNRGASAVEIPGLTVTQIAAGHSFAKFDLTLTLAETDGCITGGLEYATALFDQTTIERHVEYLRTLLQAMVADDGRAIDQLPLLSDAERHQLLVEWNATAAEYPREQCIHELFEAQAARMPEAIAVVHEDAQLTYGELNARANRLAHHLRILGVKPDALVGICVERSLEMIVGLLAILKAGGAYVPLDPSYPAERLAYMLEDSAPVALLTHPQAKPRLSMALDRMARDLPLIDLEADAETWARQPAHNPQRGEIGLTSCHLAYVIYTSGSTGQPKGVMVEHRAVGRLVLNSGYAKFQRSDRVALAANPAFDASTLEIWAPLLNGGHVVVIDQAILMEPERFRRQLQHHEVNVLWLTVALFNQYADVLAEAFAHLTYLIVGGDVVDPLTISRVLEKSPPRHLINGYGPTETTTFAATYEICNVPEGLRSIPIGRPIANTRIYILDGHGEPVPIGVTGEIYIGGVGVARGYLNRPELTAERFLADPFAAEPGARMFRSGDLGRYLADGNIEFLGRRDFQVKIRGFRVELGEIEAQLAQHPAVRETVVAAREDETGDKRLIAYYTLKTDAGVIEVEALRRYLAAVLPEYMVPSAYVKLDGLPLTANGKLDRQALPAPDGTAYAGRDYAAPVGEIESRLAEIWAEVLGLERVGRHDNFFELGGHSLLAVNLAAQVERIFGKPLPLAALFQAPKLEQLAHILRQQGWSAPSSLSVPLGPFQSNGSRAPFFCVHGYGLINARQYVIQDQPLYALIAHGLDGRRAPATIQEMASDYLREISTIQPNGPYFLGGFSAGGLIAFEMAQQLTMRGQKGRPSNFIRSF
jgi:amino acid adenylation domain-containing protein